MISYNLSNQENEYWCFPACLQAVLRRHQIEETQGNIADIVQINPNDSQLNEQLNKISTYLRQRGFDLTFYNYNETPLNEPDSLLSESIRKGLDVLVAVPVTRAKHILLLKDFRDPELTLLDPEGPVERKRNIYDLIREMQQEQTGGFCVINRLEH